MMTLDGFLRASAQRYPQRVAVEDPAGHSVTYRQLDLLSDQLSEELRSLGVVAGDRVGFCFAKSIAAVVSIFGILKAGAAYVPVDPEAPVSRNVYILKDCEVRVVLATETLARHLGAELEELGYRPPIAILDEISAHCKGLVPTAEGVAVPGEPAAGDPQLAYILYTSGSTGRPKGVMLSHGNAVAFLDWCSQTFQPTCEDRFSSHAPLHFDLSILDVHLSLRHGAALVLISEEVGKDPLRLAPFIAERAITVWYSAPSILSLLIRFGRLGRYDYSALRLVLFAGEVFPVRHLRPLQQQIPEPRYFNLYGPTETNVCTFYEIPRSIPAERSAPYPIGESCAGLETKVIDTEGQTVSAGEVGELCVRGGTVTGGYWNLPSETARAFLGTGDRAWYRTGDLVRQEKNRHFLFLGRRDRMVKRRGYRIELDEIEHCLYRHPTIVEAAAVAFTDGAGEVRIRSVVSCRGKPPTILDFKRFVLEHLPAYMAPDRYEVVESLPRTSTGKVDYQRLADKTPRKS